MRIAKYIFLLMIGGFVYCALELIFRGHTHWTMFFVGGCCFILCGLLNEVMDWDTPLPKQMLICAVMITAVEFLAGVILNRWLGLAIWDYSHMPLNLLGQICLPFSVLWYFLSLIGIVLDDYLRYWMFGEEHPHYSWRRKR